MPIVGTLSSLSARTYGFLSGSQAYDITASTTSVNEGSSVSFTVSTINVADGTVLYWTTNIISGVVNGSDFTDSLTSGSTTINNNGSTIIRTLSADVTFEGSESFQLQLRTGSISGTIVATSQTVTINDTSFFAINTPTLSASTPTPMNSISLTGSAFSTTAPSGATHNSTQWQLATDSNFSEIFYDNTTASNLTSVIANSSSYNFSNLWNLTFYGRVRYNGSYGGSNYSSDWSSIFTLSAATASLNFELIGGGGNTGGRGGGGGGGGAERKTQTISNIVRGLPITITVAGGGGTSSVNQRNSAILETAIAGGTGVGEGNGGNGACGGGAGSQNVNWTGGTGSIGGRGGNAAGWGDWTGAGGGGGGMSSQGQDGAVNLPGNGGSGQTSWWGDTVCGGGAGGGWNLSSTKYRSGADGGGNTTVSGAANRGGGGGGCTTTGTSPGTGNDVPGGAGGSGRITINTGGLSYSNTGSPQISGNLVRFNGTASFTLN